MGKIISVLIMGRYEAGRLAGSRSPLEIVNLQMQRIILKTEKFRAKLSVSTYEKLILPGPWP